jgi:2,5-diketo-D-gluconate reductase B
MPLAVGKVMDDETLINIAEARNLTPAQVALAWVASKGVVVIPSSTRATHQKANLEALDVELSAEEITRIDGLDRNQRIANPGFAPAWD